MSDRPNILVITTDQQSATAMSCAGNRWLNTPAMDALAARGTRFTRAYVGVPVCIPSRFCMHTGRLASEINLRGNPGDNAASAITPERLQQGQGWLLQRAGYRALFAGKRHLPGFTPEDIGFEVIEKDERDRLAQGCAEFLAQPPGDRPFALYAHFINPHDICYMGIRDRARTDHDREILKHGRVELEELDRALQRPPGLDDEAFFAEHCPPLPGNFEVQDDEPEAFQVLLSARPFRRELREQWTERRWREHRWAYMRLVERVDGQIGRVLAALAESPHADNTVVIFTSDHGDMDASHRFEHKTLFYEEAAKVPLIVAGPGLPRGAVDNSHVVSNALDLLPTVCDFAGAYVPDDLWGRSLRPLLQSENDWRAYTPMVNQLGYAIVSRTHKYCRYDHGASAEQLYDLVNDPGETRNALHDAQHAAALAQHRDWFDDYWATRRVELAP